MLQISDGRLPCLSGKVVASIVCKGVLLANAPACITLHVDAQTTLETDETAELDNYAKSILDGLEGPNGTMIDDTQVQALAISRIDGYGQPSFTVAARSSPDDFVLKPQEFYEMPDGLWYPHGRVLWTDEHAKTISDFNHYAGLSNIELMSSTQRRIRAEARKAGANSSIGRHERVGFASFRTRPHLATTIELQMWTGRTFSPIFSNSPGKTQGDRFRAGHKRRNPDNSGNGRASQDQ
ncbi:hypothetical protein [Rhizobium sullae]|uniref:hypothetical protein n=1 Tax=Rhizobium sullae TaxID=50338 RepID=UPI0018E253B2|nr:hypothetical protein [Rhizobium sullae]